MASLDRISLMDVECRARLGVPEWERKKPQKIRLDIEMEIPLAKAGRSDNVRDTVDYWAIEKAARKIAENGEYRLAEHLAWQVAESVLGLDRRLRSVSVALHKRPQVMPSTREVVVKINRTRQNSTTSSFPRRRESI